jgi:2,3-diketo-5-methylthiopentyl-1-phosphate enolase
MSEESAVDECVVATYEVAAGVDVRARAEQMALGMTVGSWTALPGANEEHLIAHCGRVESVEVEGERAQVAIAYPVANLPPHLSALLTVVFGKLSLDGDIRLAALRLPACWRETLPGPGHGIAGLRARLGVDKRPVLMSIFKSENGRTLAEWRAQLEEQWRGGADLVKDDEIFFADGRAPALDRVAAAREIAERIAAESGRRPLYAVNLTAPGPRLAEQAARLMERGAEAFLMAPYTVGLDALTEVARLPGAPIILAHPAFAGAFVGVPRRGVAAELALGLLPRAAGADIAIYPSPYGSVALPMLEALAVHRAVSSPSEWRRAASAPSAGIHPGLVPRLVRDFGPDVVVNAGGAVHGHPGGTRAGALAFRQALDRFFGMRGPVPDELAQALALWGGAA